MSVLVAVLGGLAFQVPIGWLSDRFDRRIVLAALGLKTPPPRGRPLNFPELRDTDSPLEGAGCEHSVPHGQNRNRSRQEPKVRIQLPPADSPSLAGFLLTVSKSRQLPRRARARPGGTAGRDAPGSSTLRQLPVMSLSGSIPVPQRRRGGSRPWLHCCAKRGRVSDVTGSGFGPAQAKPSTARCSCQVNGRCECASSLSAVRSSG